LTAVRRLRRKATMHASTVRHIHASRIFHAIRLKPLISQRELSQESGFDKSTVSAVVKQFEARGLVERDPRLGVGRPGRPSEGLRITGHDRMLLGIHLRPGELTLGAAALDGRLLGTRRVLLPDTAEGLPATLRQGLGELLAELGRNEDGILSAGVVLPGLVGRDGNLAQSPNLGWSDVRLRAMLTDVLSCPFQIENSTNTTALAEYLFGAAVDQPDFVYLESGSGVGAGIFLGGELMRGTSGYGGEVGHMKIVPDGRLCRCGASGCLSAYVSNYSILQRLAQRGLPLADAAALVREAGGGHPEMQPVLTEAGWHLGQGIANIINIFNPPLILLGGGLAALFPQLRPSMEASVARLALAAPRAACRIDIARLVAAEAPWGGLALALEGCTSAQGAEGVPW
jgi:predicted NBD/HSP70 family sugar kinase